MKDYFGGGFDLGDLTKEAKTNGDGPILPGEDAQDFSEEESLADDEGETGNQEAGEDIVADIMQEGKVKEDEEDRMSVDLFGPEMSSQPIGQHFGADNLIALLGRDGGDEQQGFLWSDERHDGIFEELSPQEIRAPTPEEAEVEEEEMMELTPEPQEPKRPAAELVKEWFPEFSAGEIPRFTEIFGTHWAELSKPVAKTPKGTKTLKKVLTQCLCLCD